MATAVVSGIIDINNAGSPFDDLALKVYTGMVLAAYNKKTTTAGRHVERNIQSGKSAQFPVIGRSGTGKHTRGEEVTFQQVAHNEKIITIEDLLLAPHFLDVLDEAKVHYEIRSEYAVQQGQALAEAADERVFMSQHLASNTAVANFTGGDGGVVKSAANASTDASVLKGLIYDAAEVLDNNSIPEEDRFLWLRPAQFYILLQDGEFIDRDFSDGANGSRSHAVMRNAADFMVIKTTNMPNTDRSADGDLPSHLAVDYTNLVAMAAHSSAAGSVTLIGLQFETEYDMNRQGHMLIAKYAKGFNALRPESAVSIENV